METGESLDDFLEDFPSVSREQVVATLELAGRYFLHTLMRILLDECLPKKLKRELIGHNVFTVQEKGWSGVKNGELLYSAEKEFDVWVTADQNIEFQHNLSRFNIAVAVLVAPRNKLEGINSSDTRTA